MVRFALDDFSRPNLTEAFASRHAPAPHLKNHKRIQYLAGYLENIKARSILVEDPYIDGDYLDDYAAYYAKCFIDYGR